MKNIDTIINNHLVFEDGEVASGAITTDNVAKYPKKINFPIQRRKKKKKIIEEAAKPLPLKDIINALGGEDFYKKFKTVDAAYKYTVENIKRILVTFDMKMSDVPLVSLERYLRKIIKGV